MLSSTQPIQVIREGHNRLTRRRYVFDLDHHRLVLVRYHYEVRRKIGAPWHLRKFYEQAPSGIYGSWEWVQVSDIPWDSELEQEAKEAILEGLVVLRETPSD